MSLEHPANESPIPSAASRTWAIEHIRRAIITALDTQKARAALLVISKDTFIETIGIMLGEETVEEEWLPTSDDAVSAIGLTIVFRACCSQAVPLRRI